MSQHGLSPHVRVCLGSGALALAAFALLMSYFLPNLSGRIGHDYSYFLPRLLDGYLWWRENGLSAVPWFTPSFLGGVPAFPNPQGMYYSLPQALTIVFDPVMAVYLTVLVFGLAGFCGMCVLLAGPFRATPPVAALGAFIFMFNGFFTARMITGHFAYHCFPLIPWIVYFTVRAPAAGRAGLARDSAAAGLMFTYMAYSGGLTLAPVMLVATLASGLIHTALHGGGGAFAARLAGAGALSMGLSAPLILSAMSFTGGFVRAYSHAGPREFLGVVYLAGSSLFFPTDGRVEAFLLAHAKVHYGLHEFDFSISPVPLLLIIIGGYAAARRLYFKDTAAPSAIASYPAVAGAAALLVAPLLANWSHPAVDHIIKAAPVLKYQSSQFRLLAACVTPLIILACLAVERTPALASRRGFVCALGAVLFVFSALGKDWNYYFRQGYNPNPVVKAYWLIRDGDAGGRIDHIGLLGYEEGERAPVNHPASGTMFVQGASPMFAYEPLFGYGLEKFPVGALAPGAVMAEKDGRLNLKNPACYLYPVQNGCVPGDHFTIAQKEQADLFRRYKPFPFAVPFLQTAANWGMAFFIPACVLALAAPWLASRRGRGAE